MFFEIFTPYEHLLVTLSEKKKKILSLVFTNMFLLPLWNLKKKQSFAESPKSVKVCEIFLT